MTRVNSKRTHHVGLASGISNPSMMKANVLTDKPVSSFVRIFPLVRNFCPEQFQG